MDLTQFYDVAGSLAGRFEIDYRILVKGPCGSPPGTYAEEWIAHGRFTGEVEGPSIEASLTYLASSDSSGDIRGKISFADGVRGDLDIAGNFSAGRLNYDGWVTVE